MKIIYLLTLALMLSACVSDKDPLKDAANSGCFHDPVTGKFDVDGYLADPYGRNCKKR